MKLNHMIDFCDLPVNDWNAMYELASDIKKAPGKYSGACSSKVLATLFYEPSTRTRLSFQTAMLRLGGRVIGFDDPASSSVKKGESLRDTVKIVSLYSDIAVIRNPVEGAAYAASLYSGVPVINAGDGGHLHPTQTMADMFTITREKKRCSALNIGFCGDLLNGRTVHSLMSALSRYPDNTMYLISAPEFSLPADMIEQARTNGVQIKFADNLSSCLGELDILYMTRIQRERYASGAAVNSTEGFILTSENLKNARDDLLILHPLPKIDEISYEVDDDPRAKYFEQAENGLYMRMALILMLCEANPVKFPHHPAYPIPVNPFCSNPRCISNHEKYLPEMVNGGHCAYCGKPL